MRQQQAGRGGQAAIEPERLQRSISRLRQKLYPVLILRSRQAPTCAQPTALPISHQPSYHQLASVNSTTHKEHLKRDTLSI